jgi:hypothetical protein
MGILALLFLTAVGWACRRSMDDPPQQWISPATSVVPLELSVTVHVHIPRPAPEATRPKPAPQSPQSHFLN